MFDKGWTGLFKQATEMQSKLAEMQEGLAEKTVEISTGGGMVKVVSNGLNEIISVKIDDELINMNDREVLEDLITGAVNEASLTAPVIKSSRTSLSFILISSSSILTEIISLRPFETTFTIPPPVLISTVFSANPSCISASLDCISVACLNNPVQPLSNIIF